MILHPATPIPPIIQSCPVPSLTLAGESRWGMVPLSVSEVDSELGGEPSWRAFFRLRPRSFGAGAGDTNVSQVTPVSTTPALITSAESIGPPRRLDHGRPDINGTGRTTDVT